MSDPNYRFDFYPSRGGIAEYLMRINSINSDEVNRLFCKSRVIIIGIVFD